MPYFGNEPAKSAIKVGDNTVLSATIANGVIINEDIKSDAAIAMSKTALAAGTGITLATNTLNVDAAQTQITSVGTLTGLTTSGNLIINHDGANSLRLGASADLQLYHNGSTSAVTNATGILYFWNNANANTVIGSNNVESIVCTGADTIFRGTGNFAGDVTIANNNQILGAADGVAYSFTGDTDTGIQSGGTNTIQITTGGSKAMDFDGNQLATFTGDVTMSQSGQAVLHLNSSGDAAEVKLTSNQGTWSMFSDNAVNAFLINDGTTRFTLTDTSATFAGKVYMGGSVKGRSGVKMSASGVDWTDGNWSEVWNAANTPGNKYENQVFAIDTNRAGGVTGGIVGLSFSPGWTGHQNWGIYSLNNSGGGHTQGDLVFVSTINDGTLSECLRLKPDKSATFAGNLAINGTSGDTVVISKSTTEPSIRIEGDTGKDFVVAISGELLTVTQNDGGTDILTLDHDTKNATFAGKVNINDRLTMGNSQIHQGTAVAISGGTGWSTIKELAGGYQSGILIVHSYAQNNSASSRCTIVSYNADYYDRTVNVISNHGGAGASAGLDFQIVRSDGSTSSDGSEPYTIQARPTNGSSALYVKCLILSAGNS